MRLPVVLVATLLLFVVDMSPAIGQAPDLLSFQGYITNPAGTPIDAPSVSITFKLYEDGSTVWTEIHTSVKVEKGVFNVLLGGISSLRTIAFNVPLELGIAVGGDPEISPRSTVAGAAYAKALPGLYTFYRNDGSNSSLNVVGGWENNVVGAGVVGATIGGGGGFSSGNRPNSVLHDYATVSGGALNTASGSYATIGGGYWNTANGTKTTVGGGDANEASDTRSTVGGGWSNEASGQSATIGGGESNTASSRSATIGGGWSNDASGSQATVGGGYTNKATDTYATVGGGGFNSAGGANATVAGGRDNIASGIQATVGGGFDNTASGSRATVPGGSKNSARGYSSFAAGDGARAIHDGTFVWNDRTFSSGPNDSLLSTGPNQFIIRADGGVAIGTNGPRGMLTVRGANNHLMGPSLVFVGASGNQVEAGRIRFMDGVSSGNHRGAYLHYDGDGNRLHIGVHETTDALAVNDADIITIERASGDLGIRRNNPSYPLHVGDNGTNGNGAHVTDGGTWTDGSSRTFKEDIRPVNNTRVLQEVLDLPVYRWRYKGSDEGEHMGPVAEDFFEAFELGNDERYISGVDGDGVALAAIQGLYEIIQKQQAEIEQLKRIVNSGD